VTHQAGDEARIDRARPHDARQRLAQRSGARPARIGRVEHHQIGRGAERSGGGRKAADMAHVSGAFEQVAARIV
jgi:hypothetical protein